jgi:hypothetical protein
LKKTLAPPEGVDIMVSMSAIDIKPFTINDMRHGLSGGKSPEYLECLGNSTFSRAER